MQSDNLSLMTFGRKPSVGYVQFPQPATQGTIRSRRGDANGIEPGDTICFGAWTAISSVVFICETPTPEEAVLHESLVLEAPAGHESNQPEKDGVKIQWAQNLLVEMSPSHKSLHDVPREKMSDFERNYPW